jgi:hypothetical protein
MPDSLAPMTISQKLRFLADDYERIEKMLGKRAALRSLIQPLTQLCRETSAEEVELFLKETRV